MSSEQPDGRPIGPWIGVLLISLGALGLLSAVISIVHSHSAAIISVIIGGVLMIAGIVCLVASE